ANRDRLQIRDPYAAAIIVHNTVEHAAHTAKFIGPEIEASRLIESLADIIYTFFSTRINTDRK
ncbi:MAG: TetR/AcrR family transcriptional regulator, partial [Thermodesulfobacteriota bacterium]|nr:TetR/AcrR family transcriptional regulator [Thermodesulfobacteriota bacterium]